MRFLFLILPFLVSCATTICPDNAELKGISKLPADVFMPGPPSGAFLKNSSKGKALFASQPFLGVSSIWRIDHNSYYVLPDNGYGAKSNSKDFELRIYKVKPNFKKGIPTVDKKYISLRDPNKKIDFKTVNRRKKNRFLTGADFDVESFVRDKKGDFWVGEEFGPYLLHFNSEGVLLEAPISVPTFSGDFVRSPDHPSGKKANLPRSRGFEGLAIYGDKLYALLEGTLKGDPVGNLRLMEFDLKTKKFTGKYWFYQLASDKHAIGEIRSLGNGDFVVIERDGNKGDAAAYKKVFSIKLGAEEGLVIKRLVIDLLKIKDQKNIAGYGPNFRFPFETIESIWPLSHRRYVLANDNNFPASGGRGPNVKNGTEFILVEL